MNNSQVAHYWANQSKDSAHGSNFYFDGNEIYSYGSHFLAAEILGKNTYWINDKGYSNSTAKHLNHIYRAISLPSKKYYYTSSDFNYVNNDFKYLNGKFSKANKPYMYYKDIRLILDKYKKFNSFVNSNKDAYFRFYSYITIGSKKERQNLINRMQYFLDVHSHNIPIWQEDDKIRDEKKEARLKRKREIALLEAESKIPLFYNYEASSIYGLKESLVRISKDKTKVQTTHGANVPINEAKTLYNMILNNKDIKGFNIGGFTVISINGTLKIGCHDINIESMHKTGKELLTLNI